MVRFSCSRTSEDMTPVIRDIEIAKFAEKVLYDYRSELLDFTAYTHDPYYKPALLNPYDFAEHYLGADIEVHDIYTDSKEDVIAGAAVFNLQKVKIFDKENMSTRDITVEPNTIILDTETLKSAGQGFEYFTIMHEAGHLMLHQKVFCKGPQSGSGKNGDEPEPADNLMLCKRSNIGRSRGGLVTSEDFREHQVNTFAASMLMPPRVFIPYVQLLMERYQRFRDEGLMMTYEFAWGDPRYGHYLDILSRTAHQFGVSGKAVRVQLTKYGLQASPKEEDVREARRRLKMYQSLYR